MIWSAVIFCNNPDCPSEGCIINKIDLISDPEFWAAQWNSSTTIEDTCLHCGQTGDTDFIEAGVPFMIT